MNTHEADFATQLGDAVIEARTLAALCARANAQRRSSDVDAVRLTMHTGDRSQTASRQVHRLVASR